MKTFLQILGVALAVAGVFAIGYLISVGLAWIVVAITGWKISVWTLGAVIFVLHYIFSK